MNPGEEVEVVEEADIWRLDSKCNMSTEWDRGDCTSWGSLCPSMSARCHISPISLLCSRLLETQRI